MEALTLSKIPVAKTGMLIRRPIADVFEALVDPDQTTQFWFTKSSGRLVQGETVKWEWEMFGVSLPIEVKELVQNERIVLGWPNHGIPTVVEWTFRSLEDGNTFVEVVNSGFVGDGDAVVHQATESGQGFTRVLVGLKAYLEHGIVLNLAADRFPKRAARS